MKFGVRPKTAMHKIVGSFGFTNGIFVGSLDHQVKDAEPFEFASTGMTVNMGSVRNEEPGILIYQSPSTSTNPWLLEVFSIRVYLYPITRQIDVLYREKRKITYDLIGKESILECLEVGDGFLNNLEYFYQMSPSEVYKMLKLFIDIRRGVSKNDKAILMGFIIDDY